MSKALSIVALLACAGAANGQVVISEVLGSTAGSDWEYIEIANLGGAPVNIGGWQVELWDSDGGAQFGTLDGLSPYIVNAGTILAPGGVWVIGNARAFDGDAANPDGYDDGIGNESYAGVDFFRNQSFADNSIENSSYTVVLANAASVLQDSWYFRDGVDSVTPGSGAGDLPNRAGVPIVPNFSFIQANPTFSVEAGAYRVGGSAFILNFNVAPASPPYLNDGTLAGGTPGYNQIPAPGAMVLAGVAGLAASRRRRA